MHSSRPALSVPQYALLTSYAGAGQTWRQRLPTGVTLSQTKEAEGTSRRDHLRSQLAVLGLHIDLN
eukprot:2253669-Pyramimonas_sp.AAC.1